MTHGTPWLPSPPFWDAIPGELGESAREDYEERAAIMEHDGNMAKGLAEAAAYAFAVADSPERSSVCLAPEEIDRQVYIAAIIRRHMARFEPAWRASFRPWVRELDPSAAARRAA